jgi:hypothetical protein
MDTFKVLAKIGALCRNLVWEGRTGGQVDQDERYEIWDESGRCERTNG